jgi:hypothetical protein
LLHGVVQFNLTGLPDHSFLTSATLRLFKQGDQLDPDQEDAWSVQLIETTGDILGTATFTTVHEATLLATLVPTWTTAQLDADAPGAAYTLSPDTIDDLNDGILRHDYLTFRLEGAVSGESSMAWDTGFLQDPDSLGVCAKPQLLLTYDLRHVYYLPTMRKE